MLVSSANENPQAILGKMLGFYNDFNRFYKDNYVKE